MIRNTQSENAQFNQKVTYENLKMPRQHICNNSSYTKHKMMKSRFIVQTYLRPSHSVHSIHKIPRRPQLCELDVCASLAECIFISVAVPQQGGLVARILSLLHASLHAISSPACCILRERMLNTSIHYWRCSSTSTSPFKVDEKDSTKIFNEKIASLMYTTTHTVFETKVILIQTCCLTYCSAARNLTMFRDRSPLARVSGHVSAESSPYNAELIDFWAADCLWPCRWQYKLLVCTSLVTVCSTERSR